MALPLLAGIVRQFATSFAKNAIKKKVAEKIVPKKKKIKTDKFFDKQKESGALVKVKKSDVKIKSPGGSLVKYKPSDTIQKEKLFNLPTDNETKSVEDELQGLLDEFKKLRSGLVEIKGYLDEKKNSDLRSLVETRKSIQIENKKRIESELEKKPEKKEKEGIGIIKPKFNLFDTIINFFTNILLGSLASFLLSKKDIIIKAFDDIGKNLTNTFNQIRYSIISLSTTMPRLVKSLARFSKKIFGGPAKLTTNLLKKLGKSVKNLLLKTGKAIGGLVSNQFKNLRNLAGGTGTTRTTGVQKRKTDVGKDQYKKTKLRKLPKPGTPKPTSQGALINAKKTFSPKGIKHLKKVSGVFKKVPFIGALIGIGIDLAMGERLDNAIAGAAGASLGAAIGGAIGTAVLPIPFVGTFLGGTVGAAIGDWAGKEIYKNLRGKITEINPKQEKPSEPSGYSPSLDDALRQPLPGPGGTGRGMASGPGAEGLADFIAKAETGGRWNAYNGDWRYGKRGDDKILDLNLSQLKSYMEKNHPDSSGAVGAYQFMPGTAIYYAKQLGMNPDTTKFTAENQKKIHLRHLKALGYDDFVAGKITREKFGQNIAKQYRAVPDPYTGFTYDDQFKSRNRATVTNQQFLDALDKSKQQGPGTPPPAPVLPGPGGTPSQTPGQPSQPGQTSRPGQTPTSRVKQSELPKLPPTGVDPTYGSAQRYGAPRRGGRRHAGADFDAGPNDTFYSRIGGEVNYIGYDPGGYYNFVDIYNKELGVYERIAEGDTILVRRGQKISPGTPVAKGTNTTGVFHYEIRKSPSGGFENTVNPIEFLQSLDSKGGVTPTTPSQISPSQISSSQATLERTQALEQQAAYEQVGGTVIVPAPIINAGGGRQSVIGGGGGNISGVLQKDVLNSYYRAQLLAFLYKQG